MFNTAPLINLGLKLKQGIPDKILKQAITDNPVFTEESIRYAIDAVTSELLDESKLENWLGRYPDKNIKGKKIALIMAGNIPLVGISDLLCVVVLGGTPLIKASSKDSALMGWVVGILKENGVHAEPFDDTCTPDAVIATGSDTTTAVFKQKYGHLPLLVRGSRTSAAVISGPLSTQDIKNLWTDVFTHSSLGCRNVSYFLIKRGIDITPLTDLWKAIPFDNPYIQNNYRQKKAVLEMTGATFTDCGYLLFRESERPDASLGEVTYSFYDHEAQLQSFLSENADKLQCIVGGEYVPFGQAQRPTLNDWADGVDTIEFLMRAVDGAR